MEDDKLRDLFHDFRPELPSDFSFMAKLQHNLDQVEMIRRHNIEVVSKRKKAVAIAACVGFMAGFLFSLALPYVGKAMMSLQSSLTAESTLKTFADNYLTIAWCLIGATSMFISLNAYDLSFFIMKNKK